MSSHHIIRDEQEPALFALNAAWLSHDTLASLLEWSPTIIAPADQVEVLTSMDVKPDVIVATAAERQDSGSDWEDLAPVTIIDRQEHEQALIPALHYLLAKKHGAANILGLPVSPADETLQLFFNHLDIVFYSASSRWLWVRSGTYKKWLTRGTRLAVHTLANGVAQWKVTGSCRPVADDKKKAMVFEVLEDGLVSISVHSPFVLEEPL